MDRAGIRCAFITVGVGGLGQTRVGPGIPDYKGIGFALTSQVRLVSSGMFGEDRLVLECQMRLGYTTVI